MWFFSEVAFHCFYSLFQRASWKASECYSPWSNGVDNPFTKHVPGYRPLTPTLPHQMNMEKLPALGLSSWMCTGGRIECFTSETDLCPLQVKLTSQAASLLNPSAELHCAPALSQIFDLGSFSEVDCYQSYTCKGPLVSCCFFQGIFAAQLI